MSEHGHAHEEGSEASLAGPALRVRALESLLVEKGLVDRIGFIEEAVARAAELANVSTSEVRCVKYERPQALFGELFGISAAAAEDRPGLAALMNSFSPRAYYLWSWLPPAVQNLRH